MSAAGIIEKCKAQGVRMWAQDGKLQVRADHDLTDQQLDYLREHKAAILDYLTTPHGTRYAWRYRDTHNVAGWRIHYSYDDAEQIRSLFGSGVEVRPMGPAQDFQRLRNGEAA